VSFPRKRESSYFFLDCCLRRNDTCWISACAGRTRGPPHPASLDGWPPSPARGEADCIPAYAGMTRGVGAKEPGLPLTQEGHCGPLTRPAWTAGHPLPQGERRTGFLLMHEGHCGPLTRRCLGHRRPLPRWGEAYWTAACAGRTPAPACAGMTQWPPQPARPSALPPARPASPARGEADWIPDCAGMTYRPRRRPMCRSLAVAALFPSLG